MMARVKSPMRLPAPKSVQIGGNTLEVKMVPGLGVKTGDRGTCCLGTREIEIDSSMSSESKTVTLLHEFFEAINTVWMAGSICHDDIDRLGEAMYQVMGDMGIEIDWG